MFKKKGNIFLTDVFRRLGLMSTINYNWVKDKRSTRKVVEFHALDWVTDKVIYTVRIVLDHEIKPEEITDTYIFLKNENNKTMFRMVLFNKLPVDAVLAAKKVMENPDLWIGKPQKIVN